MDYVNMDVTGRFGRYKEVLGKGGFKTVYRAFDEVKGIDVAWNRVKIDNNLEYVCSEVEILRQLKHENIMRIYSAWVDMDHRHLNFITEIFTSGTLMDYRGRHRHVGIQVLRKWARQILTGVHYLHTLDPPIVHRDLKCDNIFIDGSQGDVKIGDFGLAAVLPHGHRLHGCIGTPGFIAPEAYGSDYDELVDIYSFGMCVLELATMESAWNECQTLNDVHEAVKSGKKPAALRRVQDPQMKAFVERCLGSVESRPTAWQLLLDPFLQCEEDEDSHMQASLFPPFPVKIKLVGSCTHFQQARIPRGAVECNGGPFTTSLEKVKPLRRPLRKSNVIAKGEWIRKEEHTLALTLRIADDEGHVRQIQLPFVLDKDTAMGVARQVIEEFDLLDEDLATIAHVIEAEVRELVKARQPSCNGHVQTPDEGRQEGSLDPENGMELSQIDVQGLLNCRLKFSVGIHMQNAYEDWLENGICT